MQTFWKIFNTNNIQYPKEHEIANNILPHNTTYEYISSTFINGICNYLRPFYVIGIERYEDWTITPIQSAINRLKEKTNTDYSMFPDDVLILATAGDYYWFIWADRDVSDCFIGKIERKGLNEINLITALEAGIREMGGDGLRPTENFETMATNRI